MEEFDSIPTFREDKKLADPLPAEFDEREVLTRMVPITSERVSLAQERLKPYFEHDGKQPDVIVVLAGGVTTNQDQTQESPLFTNGEDNNKMITGAKYRVVAAAIGAQLFPDAKIETNSFNAVSGQRPVDVMAQELSDLGVDPERIVKENAGKESQSTFGNIARLIELMGQNPEWNNVVIVTNEYHIPRTEKIMDLVLAEAVEIDSATLDTSDRHFRYLQREELTTEFFVGLERIKSGEARLITAPCERIVAEYDSGFAEAYDRISQTPEFAKRLSAERQGIYQLTVGSYSRTI